jgi:hypothetical protein
LIVNSHKNASLVFLLGRPGPVRFVIGRRGCGIVGAFTVHGHAGVNQVAFAGRVGGRRLPPGTYRIQGRSRGDMVLRAKLVVGGGTPSPCEHGTFGSSSSGSSSSAGSSNGGTASTASAKHVSGSSKDAEQARRTASADPRSGVLGTRVSKILPGSGGTQLALLVVLALAIFLLALGALPRRAVPHPAFAAFLARRRAMVAVAGLTALSAFLVSYFIS